MDNCVPFAIFFIDIIDISANQSYSRMEGLGIRRRILIFIIFLYIYIGIVIIASKFA